MNSRLLAVSPDNDLDYQRQLAELDSLYRNSPNGVAGHDNLYVRVNDALAYFHGTSPEKPARHSPFEFLSDVPTGFPAHPKQMLETANRVLAERPLRRSSSSGFPNYQ